MHIGPLGMTEIIVILVIVLLIFGPKNLPKLGKAIGRTVKNLREGMDSKKDDELEADETVVESVEDEAAKKPAKDE